jgi:hypothetical protein
VWQAATPAQVARWQAEEQAAAERMAVNAAAQAGKGLRKAN